MSETTNLVDVDFENERLRKNIEAMDDVTLVWTMLGLNGEIEGAPNWGQTATARKLRRVIFTEIAARWIPPEVFGAAFTSWWEDEEGGDDA